MKQFLVLALCCLALARSQVVIYPGGQIGQYPIGGQVGQYPIGGQVGQYPIGGQVGQYPIGGQVGQYPIGGQVGQYPIGGQYPPVGAQASPRLEARPGEYPYQVSLQVDGQHICGGSLISKRHVLTAAHCVFNLVAQKKDKNTIKVLVGTNTLTSGGTLMDVDRISHHGAFTYVDVSPVMNNDIAVIRLKKEVTESATVKVIGLPQPNQDIPENTRMILTGFGATYTGGPVSQKLRQLYMYATNPQDCATYWSSRGVITVAHLCASLGQGYGACQGDSGGPLVLDDKSTVVGIVSEGIGLGCESGYPDLYTRVSYYLDYINSELALTK